MGKTRCEVCGNLVRTRHVIQFHGKLICTQCKNQTAGVLVSIKGLPGYSHTPEYAQNKIRNSTTIYKKGIGVSCNVGLPRCYINKLIRVIIVGDMLKRGKKKKWLKNQNAWVPLNLALWAQFV